MQTLDITCGSVRQLEYLGRIFGRDYVSLVIQAHWHTGILQADELCDRAVYRAACQIASIANKAMRTPKVILTTRSGDNVRDGMLFGATDLVLGGSQIL